VYREYVDVLVDSLTRCNGDMTGIPAIGGSVVDSPAADSWVVAGLDMDYQSTATAAAGTFSIEILDGPGTLAAAAAMAAKLDAGPVEAINETALDLLHEYLNTALGLAVAIFDTKPLTLRFGTPRRAYLKRVHPQVDPAAFTEAYHLTIRQAFDSLRLKVTFREVAKPLLSGRKILVVDDSGVVRAYISRVLKKMGAQVEEAEDGRQAVVKHQAFEPHLTFMDLIMPKMSGLEAIQAIRRFHPEACFVMLTSSSRRDQVLTAKKLGVAAYLLKPPDEARILANVQRMLLEESPEPGRKR
jgi:CheY-like chemotaxis protein